MRFIGLLIDIGVLMALFMGVTTYLFFLYESKNAGEFKLLRNRLRDRLPGAVLKSMAMAMGSQLVVYFTYPFGFFPQLFFSQPGKRPARPDRPALVLVHGLYHNCSAWFLFKWRLRQAGFRNVYAFNYMSFNTDFFQLRGELERFVLDVAAAHGSGKVFLVGHSLGGLLCRSVLATEGGRRCAAGVVTWGAPHLGSKLAAVAIGQLGRSLEYQGPLIKTIEAADRRPECPCLNIYSPVDNFVLPTAALRIRTPGWREETTLDMSHIAMLYHPALAETTIGFLKSQRADG